MLHINRRIALGDWSVGLWSELIPCHFDTEDGPVDRVEEAYCLEAINVRGDRFVGGVWSAITIDKSIKDIEVEALKALDQLAEMVDRHGMLFNPEVDTNWRPTHPVYGSIAYLEAEPEMVEAEKQEDLRGF